jgi:two-component system response regulator AtoC
VSEPISLKLVTKKATHDLERQIILKVLKANNWNRQKTAKWLKISYRSLLYKLNEVGAENAVLNGGTSRAKTPSRTGLSSQAKEPTNLIQ